MTDDHALLRALHLALQAGDDADAALTRVGWPPWLDSRRPGHALILAGADLVPDPEAPDEFVAPHDATVVMYWGLKPHKGATRVAGLVWPVAGQAARLLRAIVLPP